VTIAFAISPGHECEIGLATFRVLAKGDLDDDAASIAETTVGRQRDGATGPGQTQNVIVQPRDFRG
jgi:hypothetical protein